MTPRFVVVATALALLIPAALRAGVTRVPGDQATIQAGVDATAEGDTVLVAPGSYTGDGNRDVSFGGKSLSVVSEGGSGVTIVDCQATWDTPHRGFLVDGGVSVSIRGFTIANGYSPDGPGGGAIRSESSYLTLADCVSTGCMAGVAWQGPEGCNGGGLYCSGGTIEATDCVFESNECGNDVAGSGSGGGAYISGSAGSFVDCEFRGNATYANGGGVRADVTGLVFDTCVFRGNSTGDGLIGGGGGFCGGFAVFRHVTFVHNRADEAGGGAYASGTFEDVVFNGNFSAKDGGGLFVPSSGGQTQVTDASFIYNSAQERGGGIFARSGSFDHVTVMGGRSSTGAGITCASGSVFSNITLVDNDSTNQGSAVFCLSGSVAFSRTLIAFNYACAVQGYSTPVFDCSDMYGNALGDWVGVIAGQYGVSGNISQDPLFCGAATSDFTIDSASPCAPANSSCGELIGALGVACSTTPVVATSWGAIKALYR